MLQGGPEKILTKKTTEEIFRTPFCTRSDRSSRRTRVCDSLRTSTPSHVDGPKTCDHPLLTDDFQPQFHTCCTSGDHNPLIQDALPDNFSPNVPLTMWDTVLRLGRGFLRPLYLMASVLQRTLLYLRCL